MTNIQKQALVAVLPILFLFGSLLLIGPMTAVYAQAEGEEEEQEQEEENRGSDSSTTTSAPTTTRTRTTDILNCADIQQRNFPVDPTNDPYNFDGDNDGIGCETRGGTQGGELIEQGQQEEETSTTTTTITTPPVAPAQQEAPVQIQGNAFMEIEQVVELSEECMAELDAAGMEIVLNTILVNNPQLHTVIETEAAELAQEANVEIPAQTTQVVEQQVDQVIDEVKTNNTELATAVEQNVNSTAVMEEVAEGQIVEELLAQEELDEQVEDAVITAVEEVLVNDVSPEVAVENLQSNLTDTVEDIEITEEEVEEAAQEVALDGSVAQEFVEEPTVVEEEEEVAAATEGNGTATQTPSETIEQAVEETVMETAPEISEQTGQDLATIASLLEEAVKKIQAAQEQLG